MSRHHLSSKEDKTTETDDIAMAAEPIHGCNTKPIGRNTPADGRTDGQIDTASMPTAISSCVSIHTRIMQKKQNNNNKEKLVVEPAKNPLKY